MTNVKQDRAGSRFVIRASSLFRHSSFGFRHYCIPGMLSPPVSLLISDCASALPCSTAC
jgi:hypothetical protein